MLLGIDVGSTGVKAVICTPEGQVVERSSHPTSNAVVRPQLSGGELALLDPEALWRVVTLTVREALDRIRAAGRYPMPRAVAVASMGCASVYVGEDGRPLYPIHYPPVLRPSRLFLRYLDELGPEAYWHITGYPLEPDNPAFMLATLLETHPEDRSRLDAVLSVADYINLRLTGVRAREFSTAGAMGLWDHRQGTWWRRLLQDLQLDESVMGSPRPSGSYVGGVSEQAANETGLPADTPVFLGGHDYLAAALAAGSGSATTLFNVAGTFDIVSTFHDGPPTEVSIGSYRAMVDHHVVPGQYSFMMESLAGRHLEWLRQWLYARGPMPPVGDSPDWDSLVREVGDDAEAFGPDASLFVPHVFGRYVPSRRASATGAFLGLTPALSRPATLQAVITGITFQLRQMVDIQTTIHAKRWTQLRTVGGGTRNRLWMQTKADVLGIPVTVPRVEEMTAVGAALLAGLGAGLYRGIQEVTGVTESFGFELYEPRTSYHRRYNEVYHEVYLPSLSLLEQMEAGLRRLHERENPR